MKPETLSKIIIDIQNDYIKRKKAIEDYIPQSGMTDMLEQKIFDYNGFIRTLETIREAVLKIETRIIDKNIKRFDNLQELGMFLEKHRFDKLPITITVKYIFPKGDESKK